VFYYCAPEKIRTSEGNARRFTVSPR